MFIIPVRFLPRKGPWVPHLPGMCGGCRVTVGGETKFACVDGPEFDGHQVDFAELTSRNGTYRDREAEVKENHVCRIESMGKALIK